MTSKIKRVKTRNEPVPSVQDRNTFRNKPITDTSITSDVPPATSETVIRNIEVSTNLTRIGDKTDETPTAESIKKRMSFARLLNNSNSAEVDKEEATSPTWSM
jgi:transcriptional regulator with PAS, ATPase and Fis domain